MTEKHFGFTFIERFIAPLFDLSFKEFITLKILKFVYILGIFINGLIVLFLILLGFAKSISNGIITLIFSPFIFIILTIFTRVWIEIMIVAFCIAENTKIIAENIERISIKEEGK